MYNMEFLLHILVMVRNSHFGGLNCIPQVEVLWRSTTSSFKDNWSPVRGIYRCGRTNDGPEMWSWCVREAHLRKVETAVAQGHCIGSPQTCWLRPMVMPLGPHTCYVRVIMEGFSNPASNLATDIVVFQLHHQKPGCIGGTIIACFQEIENCYNYMYLALIVIMPH